MKRELHNRITEDIFGKPYDEVHVWIDSDFKNWVNSKHSLYNHWVAYHNVDNIELMYGVNTIENKVARLHVLCDWLSHFGEWVVPVSRKQCVHLLNEKGVKLWF